MIQKTKQKWYVPSPRGCNGENASLIMDVYKWIESTLHSCFRQEINHAFHIICTAQELILGFFLEIRFGIPMHETLSMPGLQVFGWREGAAKKTSVNFFQFDGLGHIQQFSYCILRIKCLLLLKERNVMGVGYVSFNCSDSFRWINQE